MVTFADKADRRTPGRSKEVISPREAGLLLFKSNEKSSLEAQDIASIIGRDWEKKLHKYLLPAGENGINLDIAQLLEFASSPANSNELAVMVAVHFRGAARAFDFIKGRMKNRNLEQVIVLSEDFLSKQLGPLWRERLSAAGVSYAQ